MIRIGSISTTLKSDDFEELAFLHGAPIEFPPAGRCGWATCVVAGRTYRARVSAPGAIR